MARPAIFRVAATVLLLLTGVELFACEMIGPEQCESFGFPTESGDSEADDNCICCCTHIVVLSPFVLTASGERATMVSPGELRKPERLSSSIYHPPRV